VENSFANGTGVKCLNHISRDVWSIIYTNRSL